MESIGALVRATHQRWVGSAASGTLRELRDPFAFDTVFFEHLHAQTKTLPNGALTPHPLASGHASAVLP